MNFNRTLIISLSIVIFLILWFPWFYRGLPIEGTVVDENGDPVSGVVVAATWILEESSFHGSIPRKVFVVGETVTDENGKYHIKGWGPKIRPMGKHLRKTDPYLLLHKKGYQIKTVSNDHDIGRARSPNPYRYSDWNNKKIAIEKLNPGDDIKIYWIDSALGINLYTRKCGFDEYPLLTSSLGITNEDMGYSLCRKQKQKQKETSKENLISEKEKQKRKYQYAIKKHGNDFSGKIKGKPFKLKDATFNHVVLKLNSDGESLPDFSMTIFINLDNVLDGNFLVESKKKRAGNVIFINSSRKDIKSDNPATYGDYTMKLKVFSNKNDILKGHLYIKFENEDYDVFEGNFVAQRR
jgi:hypothetical protein